MRHIAALGPGFVAGFADQKSGVYAEIILSSTFWISRCSGFVVGTETTSLPLHFYVADSSLTSVAGKATNESGLRGQFAITLVTTGKVSGTGQ